jgi:hypothetical protein
MIRLVTFIFAFFLAISMGAAQTNHGVTLNWTVSTSASCLTATPPTCASFGYNVFEGSGPGLESTTPLNSSLVTTLTFADNGPTMNAYLGQTRCYVVQAVEVASGLTLNSANSNEVCFSFPQAPAGPGSLNGSIH